jgi:hypothetical protein
MGSSVIAKVCPHSRNEAINAMTFDQDCESHTTKKRAVIAFAVTTEEVFILGVFYGGQDYETLLHDDPDNSVPH